MTSAGENRANRDAAAGDGEGRFGALAEPLAVDRLVGEGLHGADGVDRLLGIGAEPGDRILALARQMPDAPPVDKDRHDDDRDHQ